VAPSWIKEVAMPIAAGTESEEGQMMTSARKISLKIDVSGLAPSGCDSVAADLFFPSDIPRTPILWCCVPGGGISRAYFDLDIPARFGDYSMASYLAERGQIVLTIDPPGVGDSDLPDDGYELAPRVVADVIHHVVTDVVKKMAAGDLEGMPAVSCGTVFGVGHSAGGLLIGCQQGRRKTFGAVALLGYSANGLPSVLSEDEASYRDRPEDLVGVLPGFVRKRFGDPLPMWGNGNWSDETPNAHGAQIERATAKASSRLLALVGMSALVPGSIKTELDQIYVPTFAGMGEVDIAGHVSALPGQLPACSDLTLFTLAGSGHLHNIADSRFVLWERLLGWIESIAAVRPPPPG
jgi:pimeloyl-ACP methyl ester carboxylesterase